MNAIEGVQWCQRTLPETLHRRGHFRMWIVQANVAMVRHGMTQQPNNSIKSHEALDLDVLVLFLLQSTSPEFQLHE